MDQAELDKEIEETIRLGDKLGANLQGQRRLVQDSIMGEGVQVVSK